MAKRSKKKRKTTKNKKVKKKFKVEESQKELIIKTRSDWIKKGIVNKKGYEKHNKLISDIGIHAQKLKKELLILIDQDSEAFNRIMSAFKLSKKTEDDRRYRGEKIIEATKDAINTPLLIMEKSSKLLDIVIGSYIYSIY